MCELLISNQNGEIIQEYMTYNNKNKGVSELENQTYNKECSTPLNNRCAVCAVSYARFQALALILRSSTTALHHSIFGINSRSLAIR